MTYFGHEGTTDDLLRLEQERAAKRYIDVLRNKVNDIKEQLWAVGIQPLEDQHVGKAVPFIYSKWYDFVDTINAISGDYITPTLPRNGNIVVNREGTFYLTHVNISTYKRNLSDAIDMFELYKNNGGADYVLSNSIYFEMELYDKKRNKRLHENRIPMNFLKAGTSNNKKLETVMRFDVDSDVEPRVFMHSTDDNTTYLNIMFSGYKVLEV